MKHYFFCAGGCGVRVLEAVVHLCAPGLGPDEIKLLIIDPDAGGGNLKLTNQIINSYAKCQSAFGNKLGQESFFRTKLSLLSDGGGGAAGSWSPVKAEHKFDQVLGYQQLTDPQRRVADLLFTAAERSMKMDLGFLGHPSIGAAALSLLPLLKGNEPWSTISQQFVRDVAAGPVRAVIAGSVFGGTGASTFFPLALWLRDLAGNDANKLEVGVVSFTPYFVFAPAGGQNAPVPKEGPDVRKFPQATRAAAQFYDQMRALGHWPFASMFWLGDDTPIDLPRCPGGSDQQNPPHFLELMGARAALEFFAAGSAGGFCYYAGTAGADNNADETKAEAKKPGAKNIVRWSDIPRLPSNPLTGFRNEILKFLLCGIMHTDFYWPMFYPKPGIPPMRPGTISWFDKFFTKQAKSLVASPQSDAMQALADFEKRHVVWWDALHHTTPDRTLLLNSTAFSPGTDAAGESRVHLDNKRMRNLLHPDNPQKHGEGQTEFHKLTFDGFPPGATDGAPAYLAILARASAEFVRKNYSD